MNPVNPTGFSFASMRPAWNSAICSAITVTATKATPRNGTRMPQGRQPPSGYGA